MKQYFTNVSSIPSTTEMFSDDTSQIELGLKEFKNLDKKEYRRQMHLLCEHRRRGQIQTALNDLQKIISIKGNSRPVSKIAIITETIETILRLEGQVKKMKKNIMELNEVMKQINNELNK